MEYRFSVLRKHLDELGYPQPLVIDAVPLVERLLSDLVKTTESLHHYKNVAQTAIEERDHLQLGAEPYKCDNAKLVKECNDLHLAFMQFREQTDKLQKDLKYRINTLEKDNEELMNVIGTLKHASDKSKININRKTTSRTIKTADTATKLKKNEPVKKKDTATPTTGKKVTELTEEVNRLKTDLSKHTELYDCLKTKLDARDKEIQRLNNLLEGGRPLLALNKDCCYKDMSSRLGKLSDENLKVSQDKRDMQTQLADALSKQHEAMKRCLTLAERNKELERELRDIDRMALAVEAECNSTVRHNANKVTKYQQQLDESQNKIDQLERELSDAKRAKHKCQLELDSIKEQKGNLQMVLDNVMLDKKRLTDKINQFTRIEHDLNLEIDRLVQTSTLQKRKISELECQLVAGKLDQKSSTDEDEIHQTKSKKDCICCGKCKKCKCRTKSAENNQLKNEMVSAEIEKIQNEKDFYVCECKKLREEIQKLSQRSNDYGSTDRRKVAEQCETVARLERDNRDLMREKHDLLAQIESMKELKQWGDNNGGSSLKSVLTRVERERDMAKTDVTRLEEERDTLRRRLKSSNESHITERDMLQKLISESEEKFRKLEADRREMMTVQGSRRATINNLEEELESLKTQLRTTKSDLEHIQTLYGQVKTLQEQTDLSLSAVQGQLVEVEMEYAHAQERIRELERDRADLEHEVSTSKNEICVLRGNLAKLDSERDNLIIEIDNKTERVAALEQEVKSKENKLLSLEQIVAELKQKLSLTNDDKSAKDYLLKNSSSEVSTLKRELDEANKMKVNALAENRRLQDELGRVTLEYRNVNAELDRAMRQIEDLTTQLQQYVFEIKRAEDLISKKEGERSEMLDQFRSLSHEATILENSNHTLETKAFETKSQLSAALDHISDLENKVEQQNTLNRDYEKQITQLTAQIASLETQIRQHASVNNRTENDLTNIKDLCVKLDEQKDKLMRENTEKDTLRTHLEHEKDRLKVEIKELEKTLNKEHSNIGSLEHLLSVSRQETVEQRLLNQELHGEIQRLKSMVEELQSKLMLTSQQLDVFQEKSLDYSQQIKMLRREIANERFHSHSVDFSNRYPSL